MKKLLIAFVFIGGMLGKSLAQQKTTTTQKNTKTEKKTTTQTQKDTKTQTDPKKQETKKEVKKEEKKEVNQRIENCNPIGYIRDITDAMKSSWYKFLRSYNFEGPSNKRIEQQ
jgi:Ni/Co efflux regulator RcnB